MARVDPQALVPRRVALVTGASNGIGRAIALALAARHMRVWLVGRDEQRLHAVAADVRRVGGEPHVVQVELEDDEKIRGLVAEVSREDERLDVLVHAAGVAIAGASITVDPAVCDPHHKVNVLAPMRLTAGVLPLLERAHGVVVVVNSLAALKVAPGFASYAASKAAAKVWADTLRAELVGRHVRVCSMYPGQVATDMQAAIYAERGAEYEPELLLQVDDLAAVVGFVVDHPQLDVTDLSVRSAQHG